MTGSLTTRRVLFHHHATLLLGSFFAIRILSFGLRQTPTAQGILVVLLLATLIVLFIKNPSWAWYLLLAELFLGGAGHFFELFGISLRTLLLATFLTCWLVYTLRKRSPAGGRHFVISSFRNFFLPLTLIAWSIFGSLHALEYNRSGAAIIADLIPYAFFLLIFSASSLKPDEAQKKFLLRLIAAFLIGSALFSLITFILFSNGIEIIQGPYYKWFRDVAFGKITDLGSNFWRIVLPEHLLISPLMIIAASYLMGQSITGKDIMTKDAPQFTRSRKLGCGILLLSALILALNLSRTYFLALLIAFLALKYKHHWKEWLKVSFISAALIFALFTSVHLIVSGGNPGWDLLGLRFGSIARPVLEESAGTRAALLRPIWEMIKIHPIIGTGLGAALTFTHPTTGEILTTRHFDWGYLELWAELGLVGIILFMTLLARVGKVLIEKIRQTSDYHNFYVGLLGALVALAVMNVTAPVLFHVLGIVALVGVITVTTKILSTDVN